MTTAAFEGYVVYGDEAPPGYGYVRLSSRGERIHVAPWQPDADWFTRTGCGRPVIVSDLQEFMSGRLCGACQETIPESSGEGLEVPEGIGQALPMTTTQNSAFTFPRIAASSRTLRHCDYCQRDNVRTPAEVPGHDLCAACFEWCGIENEHSDYGHEETPEATCPICQGADLDDFIASLARRTRKASAAPVAASTVAKAGTHACSACHVTLPVTKFPTKAHGGRQVRMLDRCRQCISLGRKG